MPKQYTDEEYANMLPKKQIGTAVLFFNTKDELLILKPDYKDGWLVPGGSADENESPLHCAIRETKEEINLDISSLILVGTYFAHKKGYYSDSLKFIFYGGVLTDEQISEIQLDLNELEEIAFLPSTKAIPLLSNSLQKSVPQCLDAIKDETCVYIEE
jgi:8-oxo-dGTP pyrophosphatase MutT (NUDIX family)